MQEKNPPHKQRMLELPNKKPEQYIIKKWIFIIILIIGLSHLGYIISTTGLEMFKPYKSISCPANSITPCPIPETMNEYLQPGEKRENYQPNIKLANQFNYTIITMLGIGITLNHLLYNRKYKFKKLEM